MEMELKMSVFDVLDFVLKYKKKSYHWLGRQCGESKSQIYNRKASGDMKIEVLKKYADALGCDLYLKDRHSPTEWKL